LISGAAGLAFFTGYDIWKLEDHAVAAYLGVSPTWLSWGVIGTGLLLATLLASHIEYYLGTEAALRESEERSPVSSWNWRPFTAPLQSALPWWIAICDFCGSMTS
jgi:hypothetical protein